MEKPQWTAEWVSHGCQSMDTVFVAFFQRIYVYNEYRYGINP